MKLHPSISKDIIELPHAYPLVISQSNGVTSTFQRLHFHTALEINYIEQGSGYYLINGKRYTFEQGDLVLIHSNDLHRAFEEEGLVMNVIMFDPVFLALEQRYAPELLAPFRELGNRYEHRLDRSNPMHESIGRIVSGMVEEYIRKEPYFEVIVRSQLVQLLALINRYFVKNDALSPRHIRGMDVIRAVLHKIEEDIAYPWTLGELADCAHLSISRFSALFTQVVGTSPMDYLIQLRLSQAAHLLESTDKKIIEIAEECGFRNLSNFNRLFKQHVGKLPSEIRSR